MTHASAGRGGKKKEKKKRQTEKQHGDPAHQNTVVIRTRGSGSEMSQLTFIYFDMLETLMINT